MIPGESIYCWISYICERLFNAKKQSYKVFAKEMIVIYHEKMRET